MTARDKDARYSKPTQSLRFASDQWLKQVRTGIPGVVVSYDPQTARARIQPAVHMLMNDGGAPLPRPVLVDVPVLTQSGSGYISHVPLATGDPVYILFAQRCIEDFKQTLQAGAPPAAVIMGEGDAVAFAGFAPLSFTPRPGITLQTTDGETYISLEAGHVTIKADRITLEYDGGTVEYP